MTSRKNIVHEQSLVDYQTVAQPLGPYNFKRPEQAVSQAGLKHTWHEVQSVTTIPSTVFASANNYTDFIVPAHMQYIDSKYFEVTLTNGGAENDGDAVLACGPCFLFSRIEVRVNGDILQTKRDVEVKLDHLMYHDKHYLERHEASSGYDPTSFVVDTTYGTIADNSGTKTYRVKFSTFLDQCGIPIRLCKDQIVLRFYSQNLANILTSGSASIAGNVTCTSFKLYMREIEGDEKKLMKLGQKPLDWRFLDVKHEQANVALTSGATTRYITNNFDETDLVSHVAVTVRSTTQTTTGPERFLDSLSSVWFENQSGQNLHNGIQWTNTRLLQQEYPSKFPNLMSQTTYGTVYLPMIPSEDPVKAHEDGVVLGADKLCRNMKVCMTPNESATREIQVLAHVYKHVRLNGGKLTVF